MSEGGGRGAERGRSLGRLLLLTLLATSSRAERSSASEVRVTALSGGVAELPCDTSAPRSHLPSGPEPHVLLVVWYKNDTPVYSWDGRGTTTPSHWTSPGAESRFRWLPRPPRLVLRPVRPKDAGFYRCRADFKLEPSKTTRVHLTIIEPPSAPRILDAEGREVIGRAGPFKEGDTPSFFCIVTGGNPPPSIRWYQNDKIIQANDIRPTVTEEEKVPEVRQGRHRSRRNGKIFASFEMMNHLQVYKRKRRSSEPGRKSMVLRPIGLPLHLGPLKRSDLLATLSCRANNSRLVPPLTATIVIDMQLPPISVELDSREALRAGHREMVTCRARGARPPANMAWLLQGAPLPAHTYRQEESEVGDISTSVLELVVGRDQRGQQLACRATHPLLASAEPLLAILSLDILLPPDVTLRLGRDKNINSIREQDTIVLDCAVLAHPPPYKISWEQNERTVAHDPSIGIEIEWGRLTFPNIQRTDSGSYNCIASNVEGDTRSNTMNLQVIFAPTCREGAKQMKRKDSELVCEVEAYPPPSNFTWAVNTSSGILHVPQEDYSWSDVSSTLRHIPTWHKSHSGVEVLCWASNAVGRQAVPCVAGLAPLRAPAPHNCTIHNLTNSNFTLTCGHGSVASTGQTYYLTVHTLSEELLLNMSTAQPVFHVSGLSGRQEVRLQLHSVSSLGRSQPLQLTIKMPHTPTSYKESYSSLQSIALVGFTLGGLVLLLVAFSFLKFKDSLFKYYRSNVKSRHASTGIRDDDGSTVLHEEKNPDVVPLKKVEQNGVCQMRAEEEWEVAARSPRLLQDVSPVSQSLVSDTIGTWSIRAGREVVTSRTPLPVTQESCV